MKICKQCGAKIPDDSKTCPICGSKQLDEAIIMLCPSCGAINLSESKHCIKCGAQLHEEEQQPIIEKKEEVVETSIEGEEKIAKVCPNCGYVNSLGNRFCNMCGQPMFVKKEDKPVQPVKHVKEEYVENFEEEYEDSYEERGSRKNRLLNGISALFAIGFIVSLFYTWFLQKTGLNLLLESFKSLSKSSSETIFGLGALGRIILLVASIVTVIGGVMAIVNAFRGDKSSRFICVASIVLTIAFGFSFLFFYQELLSSIKTAFYLGALSNILFGAIGLFTNDEYEDYLEDEDEDL